MTSLTWSRATQKADGRNQWNTQLDYSGYGTDRRPGYGYDNYFPDQINFQEQPTLNGEIVPVLNSQQNYPYQQNPSFPVRSASSAQQPSAQQPGQSSFQSAFNNIGNVLNTGVNQASNGFGGIGLRSGIPSRGGLGLRSGVASSGGADLRTNIATSGGPGLRMASVSSGSSDGSIASAGVSISSA